MDGLSFFFHESLVGCEIEFWMSFLLKTLSTLLLFVVLFLTVESPCSTIIFELKSTSNKC